jgi:dTDP-4-amino-4,6-dideoxygalactose transaminase
MTTGGGGMVVSHEKRVAEKIRHLSTQAKSDLFYFEHDEVGYNYRMNNIQAALGVGQLENLPKRLKRKRDIASRYITELTPLKDVDIFVEQPYCKSSYWMFLLLVPENKRDHFIEFMDKNSIQTRPFWELNHRHPMYKSYDKTDLTTSHELHKRGVVIPCGAHLNDDEVAFVIEKVKNYFDK